MPLLRWQDTYGVDVIFLLFACWLPRPLPRRHWAHLRGASRRWHVRVTRRVRALRRRIRPLHWPEAYQQVLALELASERIEANWLNLATQPPSHPDPHPNSDLDHGRRLAQLFPNLPASECNDFLAALRSLT